MTPQPPDFGPGSTFRGWIANILIPVLALALNVPCLTANPYSMEPLLSQYALISRTPSATDRGFANINQGLPAMEEGIQHFAGECHTDYGPYKLRRSHVSTQIWFMRAAVPCCKARICSHDWCYPIDRRLWCATAWL